MSSYRKHEGCIQRLDATMRCTSNASLNSSALYIKREPMNSAFLLRRDPEKPMSSASNNKARPMSNARPAFLLQLTPIIGSINTRVK